VEHKGATLLKATSDAACTQCHVHLTTRDAQPHYVISISSFGKAHPEIAALRPAGRDPGSVRLNHYLHLQPKLIGPNNTRVQMVCEDCHRTSGDGAWPYGTGALRPVATTDAGSDQRPRQAYILPPSFAKNCAACHTLQFDKRFGNEQVPHEKPEIVHEFLVKKFSEYLSAHPGAVHEVDPPNRQIPERVRTPRVARNATEWIQFRVDDAEWLLYAKTCKQCHTLKMTDGALPVVAKSNLIARWMNHAEFDHHAHRMMACTACHARTPDSRETSDVLLPSIETCERCHQTRGSANEAAEGRCFECHQYHDWTKAKPAQRRFTIQELRADAK
jgi:hypothetical protein